MMNQRQEKEVTENYIKGMVRQEIYYNEENGYGVYLIQIHEASMDEGLDDVPVVGHFLRLREGEVYIFFGDWIDHPKFGIQFQVERFQKELPDTAEAIVKYLSSGLFHGVGKKTAQKIVDHFGAGALETIANAPERLKEVPGISSAQIKSITNGLQEHFAIEKVLIHLYSLGLGPTLALKIFQTYQQETLEIIKEDPYRLIDDIEGIGFQRADEIARRQGIAEDHPKRFQAAVLFLVKEASLSMGHVYLTASQMKEQLARLLGEADLNDRFTADQQAEYLHQLVEDKRLICEEDRYYLPSLYYAEYGIAKKVKEILTYACEPFSIADIYQVIGEIEEQEQVSYAEKQREAFVTALSSPLMILTGGPGTGKTTVIKGICQAFAKLHEVSLDPEDYHNAPFPIRLVAPTGRAAKRISETTGLPAMTIHRLLGFRGDFFEHDIDHPIEGILLIIDEASMLDTWLANQLFRAIPYGMQVILVGDEDQLPSVGPGQVLHHLLQVKEIPRVELNEIFRQEEGSSIIRLAHCLKEGKVPDDLLEPQEDRRFFQCNQEQASSVVLQTYLNAIKRGYTLNDVQVLAPIYKGSVGINFLNRKIQEAVNPKHPAKKEVTWGETTFRLGDKVLQLVNHSEHPVYNGDMGRVLAIDEEALSHQPVLWVAFDQLEVPYKRSQLNQLQLAYACSIHKAQGSEFPIVIFPVLSAYRHMLQRNLIYTAVTRSKSYLILCGQEEAFVKGVKRVETLKRNSRLKELIQDEDTKTT